MASEAEEDGRSHDLIWAAMPTTIVCDRSTARAVPGNGAGAAAAVEDDDDDSDAGSGAELAADDSSSSTSTSASEGASWGGFGVVAPSSASTGPGAAEGAGVEDDEAALLLANLVGGDTADGDLADRDLPSEEQARAQLAELAARRQAISAIAAKYASRQDANLAAASSAGASAAETQVPAPASRAVARDAVRDAVGLDVVKESEFEAGDDAADLKASEGDALPSVASKYALSEACAGVDDRPEGGAVDGPSAASGSDLEFTDLTASSAGATLGEAPATEVSTPCAIGANEPNGSVGVSSKVPLQSAPTDKATAIPRTVPTGSVSLEKKTAAAGGVSRGVPFGPPPPPDKAAAASALHQLGARFKECGMNSSSARLARNSNTLEVSDIIRELGARFGDIGEPLRSPKPVSVAEASNVRSPPAQSSGASANQAAEITRARVAQAVDEAVAPGEHPPGSAESGGARPTVGGSGAATKAQDGSNTAAKDAPNASFAPPARPASVEAGLKRDAEREAELWNQFLASHDQPVGGDLLPPPEKYYGIPS